MQDARHLGQAREGGRAIDRAGVVVGEPRRPAGRAARVAVLTLGHLVIARVRVEVGERHAHPALGGPVAHERRGHLARRVLEEDAVRLRVGELEGRLLEAGLGERRASGAQPVLVAASVARGELPPCLGHAAAHPHGAGGPRLEDLGAEVADLRVHRGVVGASVEHLLRAAPRHATRVPHGRVPRGAPRVEAPDVLVRAGRRVVIRSPPPLVQISAHLERRGLARAVVVGREAPAVSVARLAAEGAPLAEPEARLTRVALRLRAIRASAAVWLDPTSVRVLAVAPSRKLGVDGIARWRHDHARVAEHGGVE